MAIVIRDRVKETTTTTGTGSINMGGAVTGFRAFSSAFTTGDQTYYVIEGGSEWEVGKGTLTTGTPWTMSRDTILASSNAGAAVNFSAGTKMVYCDMPASLLNNAHPFMGALVGLSSTLTAQNYSTAAAITFTAETYDTHGFHDNVTNNTRLTVPSGYGITRVLLSGNVYLNNVLGTTSDMYINMYKNGVDLVGGPLFRGGDFGGTNVAIPVKSAVVSCSDGDYFELRIFCGDTSIDVAASYTWFSIEVIEATGW